MQSVSSVLAHLGARSVRSPGAALNREFGSRAGALRFATSLGSNNPNFVMHFNDGARLGENLAKRVTMTIDQRLATLALLHATEGDASRAQIQGATMQDRKGRSSYVWKDGKAFLVGYQNAHIAMGGYSLDGESVAAKAARSVISRSRRASIDVGELPSLARVLSFALHTAAFTEGVPAFFNQSNGIAIERPIIRKLSELVILPVCHGESAAERVVLFECERALELFEPEVMAGLCEKRMAAIKSGKAKELLQDPDDTPNLMCGGKEYDVLVEQSRQVRQAQGAYAQIIARYTRALPQRVREFMELADGARGENASLDESRAALDKPV